MTEGRVADVMGEGEGFGKILVEVEERGRRTGNLRHFDGMGEPVTEMVATGRE